MTTNAYSSAVKLEVYYCVDNGDGTFDFESSTPVLTIGKSDLSSSWATFTIENVPEGSHLGFCSYMVGLDDFTATIGPDGGEDPDPGTGGGGTDPDPDPGTDPNPGTGEETAEDVVIGNVHNIYWSNNTPLNPYWENTASVSLYTADMLGNLPAGSKIKKIEYKGYSQNGSDVTLPHVKVCIIPTSASNISTVLSTLSYSEGEVFNGSVTIPNGGSELSPEVMLSFDLGDNAYTYNGGNLLIYIESTNLVNCAANNTVNFATNRDDIGYNSRYRVKSNNAQFSYESWKTSAEPAPILYLSVVKPGEGGGGTEPEPEKVAVPVLSAESLDFGTVTEGDEAVVKTVTLSNEGEAAMEVTSVSVPTGFSITPNTATTIAAGKSQVYTITMSTETVGEFSGNVSFTITGFEPMTVAVSGTVGEKAIDPNPDPSDVTSTVVTVGTYFNDQNKQVPIDLNYNNSCSATLYTEDMLTDVMGGKITQLEYKGHITDASKAITSDIDAWIIPFENASSFNSNNVSKNPDVDYADYKVYSGTHTMQRTFSLTLPLDKKYQYDGGMFIIYIRATDGSNYTNSYGFEKASETGYCMYISYDYKNLLSNVSWSDNARPVVYMTVEKPADHRVVTEETENGYTLTGDLTAGIHEDHSTSIADPTAMVYDATAVTGEGELTVGNPNAFVIVSEGANITSNANIVVKSGDSYSATALTFTGADYLHCGLDIACDNISFDFADTYNTNDYRTAVLPFAVNVDDGIYEYVSCDGENVSYQDPTTGQIEAYKPIVIKNSEFKGFTGANMVANTENGKFNTKALGDDIQLGFVTETERSFSFAENAEFDNCYVYGFSGTTNQFVYAIDGFNARPLAAFFMLPKATPAQGAPRRVVGGKSTMGLIINGVQVSGTLTGVENIDNDNNNDEQYYNLLGQPVDRSYRGVVICKGKKIIVR